MTVLKYILQIATLITGLVFLIRLNNKWDNLRREFERIKKELDPIESRRRENIIQKKRLFAYVIIFLTFFVIAYIAIMFNTIFGVKQTLTNVGWLRPFQV